MGDFVKVANATDVKPGSGIIAEVNGKAIAVFNLGDTFYAIDNTDVAGSIPYLPAGR